MMTWNVRNLTIILQKLDIIKNEEDRFEVFNCLKWFHIDNKENRDEEV